jgi:hypothetical protein
MAAMMRFDRRAAGGRARIHAGKTEPEMTP